MSFNFWSGFLWSLCFFWRFSISLNQRFLWSAYTIGLLSRRFCWSFLNNNFRKALLSLLWFIFTRIWLLYSARLSFVNMLRLGLLNWTLFQLRFNSFIFYFNRAHSNWLCSFDFGFQLALLRSASWFVFHHWHILFPRFEDSLHHRFLRWSLNFRLGWGFTLDICDAHFYFFDLSWFLAALTSSFHLYMADRWYRSLFRCNCFGWCFWRCLRCCFCHDLWLFGRTFSGSWFANTLFFGCFHNTCLLLQLFGWWNTWLARTCGLLRRWTFYFTLKLRFLTYTPLFCF